jgi:hypothetical protein
MAANQFDDGVKDAQGTHESSETLPGIVSASYRNLKKR